MRIGATSQSSPECDPCFDTETLKTLLRMSYALQEQDNNMVE